MRMRQFKAAPLARSDDPEDRLCWEGPAIGRRLNRVYPWAGAVLATKRPANRPREASLFLVAQDIRRRIKEGSLGIEPFDESQLGGFAIDLRVGQQFRGLPLDNSATPEQAFRRANFAEIDFGESFAVEPGGTVLGVSFEYVHFPKDLAGFLFPSPRSSERVSQSRPALSTPGFTAKSPSRSGTSPIGRSVYPGQHIVRLCFGELSGPVVSQSGGRKSTAEAAENDVERIKATLKSRTTERKAESGLSGRLTAALEADDAVKGPLLEALMEELFAGVEGLSVVKRNARLRAEEIDLIVKNNLGNGFWQIAGSPIFVGGAEPVGKNGRPGDQRARG